MKNRKEQNSGERIATLENRLAEFQANYDRGCSAFNSINDRLAKLENLPASRNFEELNNRFGRLYNDMLALSERVAKNERMESPAAPETAQPTAHIEHQHLHFY